MTGKGTVFAAPLDRPDAETEFRGGKGLRKPAEHELAHRMHADRFRSGKSDQAAIKRCRDADRALQRAALAYSLVYFKERGMIRDIETEAWLADKILEDDSLLPEEP